MSSEIDFKKLWQEQASPEVPSEQEIYKKADQLKKATRNKFITGIIMLLTTMTFILYVWISWDMQMMTTKIGIALVILAILLGVAAFSKIIYVITEKDTDQSNSQYLERLMKLKKEQERLHTTILSIYFALLSTGIFLYMIEPASYMSFAGKLIAYGLTGGWIVFSWFYVRRRTIKKQTAKLNEAIENLEKLKSQL
jgi:amino acid transporter